MKVGIKKAGFIFCFSVMITNFMLVSCNSKTTQPGVLGIFNLRSNIPSAIAIRVPEDDKAQKYSSEFEISQINARFKVVWSIFKDKANNQNLVIGFILSYQVELLTTLSNLEIEIDNSGTGPYNRILAGNASIQFITFQIKWSSSYTSGGKINIQIDTNGQLNTSTAKTNDETPLPQSTTTLAPVQSTPQASAKTAP